MKEIAHYRAPPLPVSHAARALEANLAHCSDMVRQSLEQASALTRPEDRDAQDQAFARALAFIKASAKVGLALAKVKSEFTATFNVNKRTIEPGPDPAVVFARQAGDEAFWQRWTETFHRAQESDAAEAARETEAVEVAEQGDTPSNFGGSNASRP